MCTSDDPRASTDKIVYAKSQTRGIMLAIRSVLMRLYLRFLGVDMFYFRNWADHKSESNNAAHLCRKLCCSRWEWAQDHDGILTSFLVWYGVLV